MYFENDDNTKLWKVKEAEVERGLGLLFDQTLPIEAHSAFVQLAKENYSVQHCIAWWYTSRGEDSKFTRLCKQFGLNPERREIIINEQNHLMFSADYYHRPQFI